MARESVAHERVAMSRAMRTARGSLGASIATILAAASHALAGGEVTILAIAVTSVVALPLSVALAGRAGSLWRLALGVSVSQFLYHWSFAGLGLTTATAGDLPPVPAHAHHLTTESFVPALAASGAGDWAMWASHAVAAALTTLLLAYGERAALGLASLVSRWIPAAPRQAAALPVRTAIHPLSDHIDTLRDRLTQLTGISHRGPPSSLAPAH